MFNYAITIHSMHLSVKDIPMNCTRIVTVKHQNWLSEPIMWSLRLNEMEKCSLTGRGKFYCVRFKVFR